MAPLQHMEPQGHQPPSHGFCLHGGAGKPCGNACAPRNVLSDFLRRVVGSGGHRLMIWAGREGTGNLEPPLFGDFPTQESSVSVMLSAHPSQSPPAGFLPSEHGPVGMRPGSTSPMAEHLPPAACGTSGTKAGETGTGTGGGNGKGVALSPFPEPNKLLSSPLSFFLEQSSPISCCHRHGIFRR